MRFIARKSRFMPSTLHLDDGVLLETEVQDELAIEAETPSREVDPADHVDEHLRNHLDLNL